MAINTRYINQNNNGFKKAIKDFYIDKTDLIAFTNNNLESENCLMCVSRPRRFGKSLAAKMLNAYYSKGCSSKEIFDKFKIADDPDKTKHYEQYLNKYDVIYLDIQNIYGVYCDIKPEGINFVRFIQNVVINDLAIIFKDADNIDLNNKSLADLLSNINLALGNKFIFIIDEWDFIFRDLKDDTNLQIEYINLLRGLFKGIIADRCIALAYMTGILPIKRCESQSGLNNFNEYTMLSPGALAEFVGFTDTEVDAICAKYNFDREEVRRWYDGYQLDGYHIYNPKAISELVDSEGDFKNYWSDTGSLSAVLPYISMNFEGLRESIVNLIEGQELGLDNNTFANDLVSFKRKEDVIVYLIHLGYLAFKYETRTVYIPNEEIRQELNKLVIETGWSEFAELIQNSQKLLSELFSNNEEYVANFIEERHSKLTSLFDYNCENALSYVVQNALFAAEYTDYFGVEKEPQTGKGRADLVYLPRYYNVTERPVIIVELKWNKSAANAVNQIIDKKYYEKYKSKGTYVLMVGINYDMTTKKHSCKIQRFYDED
jgi:hypothetical protein